MWYGDKEDQDDLVIDEKPSTSSSSSSNGEKREVSDRNTSPVQKRKTMKQSSRPVYQRQNGYIGETELVPNDNSFVTPIADTVLPEQSEVLYSFGFPQAKWEKQTTHITVKMFNERPYIDIRKHFYTEKGGGMSKQCAWNPTRKGICMTVKDFNTLKCCLPSVDRVLAKLAEEYDDGH